MTKKILLELFRLPALIDGVSFCEKVIARRKLFLRFGAGISLRPYRCHDLVMGYCMLVVDKCGNAGMGREIGRTILRGLLRLVEDKFDMPAGLLYSL